MVTEFPFAEVFAEQRIDFTAERHAPDDVATHAALAAAGSMMMQARWPEVQADVWLGHFTQRGGDWRPVRHLNNRFVWLIRFAPIKERLVGRGGTSGTFTEQWVVVDAETNEVIRRFSFR